MKLRDLNPDELASRAYYEKLMVRKSGVRFFTAVAKKHGITVASLVFFIARHTVNQHNNGLTGFEASFWSRTGTLAKILWSSERSIKRALYKAQEAGLLDYTYNRKKHRLHIWLTAKARPLYSAAFSHFKERLWCRFQPRLAQVMGCKNAKEKSKAGSINASMIYLFIRYHRASYRTAESIAQVFPHLSAKAVAHYLSRMTASGILTKETGMAPAGRIEPSDEIDQSDEQWMAKNRVNDWWDDGPKKPETIHGPQYFCRRKHVDTGNHKPGEIPLPQSGMCPPRSGTSLPQNGTELPQSGTSNRTISKNHSGIEPDRAEPESSSPPAPRTPKPPAVASGDVSPAADEQVRFASCLKEEELYCQQQTVGYKLTKLSQEEEELSSPVLKDVKEISSTTPVVSRKPKAGAKTSPEGGAAAVPQAQEAKDKGLSGLQAQAARPAGTNGKMESKPQAAASSLQGGPLETGGPEAEEEDPVPTLGEILALQQLEQSLPAATPEQQAKTRALKKRMQTMEQVRRANAKEQAEGKTPETVWERLWAIQRTKASSPHYDAKGKLKRPEDVVLEDSPMADTPSSRTGEFTAGE